MEIEIKEYSDNKRESVVSLLFINGEFFCYSLENCQREQKIEGKTRIPKGTYFIKKRKEMTPMTTKYRDKYDWFDFHLELQDVPNFKYVYIHIGNTSSHSDGCILVGNGANNNQIEDGFVSNSKNAFKRLYLLISEALEEESVTIEIV